MASSSSSATTNPPAIPKTMKAYSYTSTAPTLESTLRLSPAHALPPRATSLREDELLIAVHAAALNPIDYKLPEAPILGRLAVGLPAIPGTDFAGRIVATGPSPTASSTGKAKDGDKEKKKTEKKRLEVGQLVLGRHGGPSPFGTVAEYVVSSQANCAALPGDRVKVLDAVCASTVALTAFQCLTPTLGRSEGAAKGKKVLINGGSGGAGTFGIQIAKVLGCHVTVTCSGRNRELCTDLGADEVVEYTAIDVVEELKKKIGDKGGRKLEEEGFDLIVDNVGLPGALYWECGSFLKPGAPYVQVGSPGINLGFVWDSLCKTLWPRFLGGGQRPWGFLGTESKREDWDVIVGWMGEGKVKAVVDEVFDFAESGADAEQGNGPAKAFAKLRSGRARGKIVVRVVEE